MPKKRRILWILLPLFLLAAAGGGYFYIAKSRQAAAVSAEPTMEIVDVEVLSRSESIEISGNIEPRDAADLAFPIAGYIDSIQVSVGDFISRGQVVATLEDSQQRYNLAAVDVEIDAEIITGTQRNLDLLELKREMTATSLEDTRLATTISGYVTEIGAEIGDYVTAQQAGSDKDVVIRVIDRAAMIATVEVDELDAPYIALGHMVEFQFDAYPDLEILGTVSSIPLEARVTTQGIAVLDVEVTIADPPEEILPYFTFAGEIFLAEDENLLLIPADAVNTRGTRTVVMAVMSTDDAEEQRSAMMAERDVEEGFPEGLDTSLPSQAPEDASVDESRPGSGPVGDFVLPTGMVVAPVQVTVEDYDGARVRVLRGLEAGDQIVVATTAASTVTAGTSTDSQESGSTSVMDLLGMPSPGNRSGGAPGGLPPGGGGPQ